MMDMCDVICDIMVCDALALLQYLMNAPADAMSPRRADVSVGLASDGLVVGTVHWLQRHGTQSGQPSLHRNGTQSGQRVGARLALALHEDGLLPTARLPKS